MRKRRTKIATYLLTIGMVLGQTTGVGASVYAAEGSDTEAVSIVQEYPADTEDGSEGIESAEDASSATTLSLLATNAQDSTEEEATGSENVTDEEDTSASSDVSDESDVSDSTDEAISSDEEISSDDSDESDSSDDLNDPVKADAAENADTAEDTDSTQDACPLEHGLLVFLFWLFSTDILLVEVAHQNEEANNDDEDITSTELEGYIGEGKLEDDTQRNRDDSRPDGSSRRSTFPEQTQAEHCDDTRINET